MLTIQNLTKSFPIKTGLFGRAKSVVRALDDVSFDVKAGEHLGIVGESGSGKTTIARILTGLYKSDSGRILFNDDCHSDPPMIHGGEKSFFQRSFVRRIQDDRRCNVQMVFQDPYSSLNPRMTVYRILVEGLTLNPRIYPKKADRERRCLEVLEAVGLNREGILNSFPHEFSGGERQRIAIARALMLDPKVLILDEAVSSLDVLMQEQILELLRQLQAKIPVTYLFISHNLKVIRKICKHVIVMHQGKIVESGPVEDVFHRPQHPYTQKLLKAALEYRV